MKTVRLVALHSLLLFALALAPPQAATDDLRRGRQLLEEGDFAGATKVLAAVVEAQPANAEARFFYGQALLLSGAPEAAVPELEFARDASRGTGAVQFVLGQAYLEALRFDEADRALRSAESERPDQPRLTFMRAEVCYQTGRLEAADRLFQRASELAPDWSTPLFRRGIVALDQQQPELAALVLERALDLQPGNPETLLVLSTARFDLEDPSTAMELLQRSVEFAPDFLPAREALAERYDRLGRADLLRQQADEMLERWPDNSTARIYRARRLSLGGEPQAALEETDIALTRLSRIPAAMNGVQPADRWRVGGELVPQAKLLRTELLARLGRLDEALQQARALTSEHPAFADGYFQLGNLLRRTGEPTKATDQLVRFKLLSDARSRRKMGDTFLEVDDLTGASAEYERALESDPDDPRALVALAQVRRRQGDADAALALLDRARGIGALATDWYTERLLALADAGRRQEARQSWVEAQRLRLSLGPTVWAQIYDTPAGCQ